MNRVEIIQKMMTPEGEHINFSLVSKSQVDSMDHLKPINDLLETKVESLDTAVHTSLEHIDYKIEHD